MSQEQSLGPGDCLQLERISKYLRAKQTYFVAIACLYAAIRLFVYSAAFPLFNSTDEQAHLDTVDKYAHGHRLSRELPPFNDQMKRLFSLYGTVEYFTPRTVIRSANLETPVAKLPADRREAQFERSFESWSKQRNTEAQSPPAYYWVAALWYRLGEMAGMRDWRLAYWMRFLNILLYGTFLWVAYAFIKEVYPDNDFLIVGVPALLAVWPQDVFYGVNREALSPLVFALALLLLFKSLNSQKAISAYLLWGGCLMTGVSFLTDIPNWVMFGAVLAIVYVWTKRRATAAGRVKSWSVAAGGLLASAFLPLIWMVRNLSLTGDLSGSQAKIEYLTWTVKPWHEIWQHPILSRAGLGYFLQELTNSYWRGEYVWEGYPLKWAVADGFYILSSCLFIGLLAAHLLGNRGKKGDARRLDGLLSLYLLSASILFLAGLSMVFDFHFCKYPSRMAPYFVSGRIMAGTLLPFAVLYVNGFQHLVGRISKKTHPVLVFLPLCAFVAISEALTVHEVFRSQFNFYHLLGHV